MIIGDMIFGAGTGGGGNNDILFVKIDATKNPYTCDKTFLEISDAYAIGRLVIGIVKSTMTLSRTSFAYLVTVGNGDAVFATSYCSTSTENGGLINMLGYVVHANGTVGQKLVYWNVATYISIYEKDGEYEATGPLTEIYKLQLRAACLGVSITINGKTFRTLDVTADADFSGFTATIVDAESKKIYYARMTQANGKKVELTEVDMIPAQN